MASKEPSVQYSNDHVTKRLPAPPSVTPGVLDVKGLDDVAQAWFAHTAISSEQLRRFVITEHAWPWAQTHGSTYKRLTERDRPQKTLDRYLMFAQHSLEARKAANGHSRSEKMQFHQKMQQKIKRMDRRYNEDGTLKDKHQRHAERK